MNHRFAAFVLGAAILGTAACGALWAQGAKGPSMPPRGSATMLKPGDVAPDFDLMRFEAVVAGRETKGDAKDRIKLSSFRAKEPVFVIFSSYT